MKLEKPFFEISRKEWQNAVRQSGRGSVYMSEAWENETQKAFPWISYRYFRYKDSHLIRVVQVGNRATSAPLGDGSDVVAIGDMSLDIEKFKVDLKKQFGDVVRLRVNTRFAPAHSEDKSVVVAYDYEVSLDDELLPRVRKTLRHTLSSPIEGEIRKGETIQDMYEAYRLYVRHMRSVRNFALPKNLFFSLIQENGGDLWVWSPGNTIGAMALFLPSEEEVLYSLSAANASAFAAHAPHHLVYTALEHYHKEGLKRASLGATGVDSPLHIFKRGWRGEEYEIYEIGSDGHGTARRSPVRNLVRLVPLPLYPSLTRVLGKYFF